MSVLDPLTLRRDLLLDTELDRRMDAVVQQASRTAALLENTRMEKSQLRNLLNVAVESRSQAVVINFIRYQIARDKDKWGTRPNDFGHTVIADLQGLVATMADEAARAVVVQMSDAPEAVLRETAYAQLMQRYLGYLNRAFYYGKETKDFARLREGTNG